MKFTRQYDKMDCGPACVRMIVSAYGKLYPLAWLRTHSCLTREGVSVAGIRRALTATGMDSGAFSVSIDQLASECRLPAILHWDQNHFVVVEGVKRTGRGRKWLIADPAFGRHTVDDDGMREHWLTSDNGVVIAAEPGEDFDKRVAPAERHSFAAFARLHVWPFRMSLAKSAAVMLAGMLLSLALPFLTQAMVDKGIGAKNVNVILAILSGQLALTAGSLVMQYAGGRVALYMSTHISMSILTTYMSKLLRLPMNFFDTKSAGDYQQRISDHSRLQSFLTLESLQTLFAIVSVPFYLAIIGSYSLPVLAVYIVMTAGAIAWTAGFLNKRRALDYEQFKLGARAQNRLYEMTNGIVDIKVNGFEEYKVTDWRNLQEEQYEMARRILKLDQKQNIGYNAIGQARNMLILCWISLMVVKGEMTLGMMMSVSVIIGMISGPLSQLTGFMKRAQDARISLERSDEVNMAENEDKEGMKDIDINAPEDIEVENVVFSYDGETEKPALADVSFRIKAGSFTAIVGESGSGKTTLMKLLLKFYNPQSGVIKFGGHPLTEYSAWSLRKACGVVMQDNYVFSDTIERNIVLGEEAESDRLDDAITTACLREVTDSRPTGIQTKIGAEGTGLSGGERQRVMIARVAYKRPPYIMLDEATSSLDASTEQQITDNISARFAGCTRIVIAHRLSTVRDADNIIVMRGGRIVETGTHDELVELNGYYLELISNQLELASD